MAAGARKLGGAHPGRAGGVLIDAESGAHVWVGSRPIAETW
jgi:hypothetical protein